MRIQNGTCARTATRKMVTKSSKTFVRAPRKPSFKRQDATFMMVRPRNQRSLLNQSDIRGPEKKDITTSTSGVSVSATPVFSSPTLLSGCAQGVATGERVGRRILMKSMLFRFNFTQTGTVGSFRVLVVYDKQTNGALPGVTDVLSSTNYIAAQNLSNSDRFIVMFDELVHYQSSTGASLYKRVNLESIYSGTTSAIASIAGGSVFFMIAPGDTGSTATYGYTARIRYTDM